MVRITVLISELKKIFKSKLPCSLLSANEAVLQAAAEMLLPENCIPELCLIMDHTKQKGCGKFGFVDLVLGDSILELKYMNVAGLYRAEKKDWKTSLGTTDLAKLDKSLENESEAKLLRRDYMFWSREDNRPKTIKLSEILLSANLFFFG